MHNAYQDTTASHEGLRMQITSSHVQFTGAYNILVDKMVS